MNVYLESLGCRLNEAELQSWLTGFISRGHKLAQTPECADILILNTCAVTAEAVKKSRRKIRSLRRYNPQMKLVVSGCYVNFKPEDTTGEVDLFIDNQDKDQLVNIVIEEFSLHDQQDIFIEQGAFPALFQRGRQRAFIKIQDGCRYRCSFCIVTILRGAERSRPVAELIEQINQYHQEGIHEVVLTGVHAGGYGEDISTNLTQLTTLILAETDIPRIRFGSLEPWALPDDFFALFQNKRLMPHLHLPLQSGSDSVLRRMARRCKTAEFRSKVMRARELIHHLNLTTDIIIGFPGETEQEWQDSLTFIEEIGFSHIHLFNYSPRPRTRAASLPDQVPDSVKKSRHSLLQNLTKRMRYRFLQSCVGHSYPVLWETYSDGSWQGYTDHFIRVRDYGLTQKQLGNSISEVSVVGISHDANYCTVVADSDSRMPLS